MYVIIGCILGLIIVFDPYITKIISHSIPLVISNVNILELFPYELSLIVFFSIFVCFGFQKIFIKMIRDQERYFIVSLLALYESIGLHIIGIIDGSDLIVLFFIIIFFIARIKNDEKITIGLIDIFNLLFISTLILSSVNGGVSSIILGLLKGFKFLFVSFLLGNFTYKKKNLHVFFAKWFIIITSISALIGIFQELIYLSTGTLIVGLIEKKALMNMFEMTSVGTFFRITAFTISYKFLSVLLITNILLVLNILFYGVGTSRIRILLYLSLILSSVALAFTFSRSAWLACFGGVLLSILLRWPSLIIHYSVGFLCLLLGLYFFGVLEDISNAISKEIYWSETRVRLQLAREGIYGCINKHHWIGNGVGRGNIYIAHFYGWPVHNIFIYAADEIGLVGFFSFILLIGYAFMKIIALNLMGLKDFEKIIARWLFIGLFSYFIVVQFEPGFLDVVLWIFIGAIQGIFLSTELSKKDFQHS